MELLRRWGGQWGSRFPGKTCEGAEELLVIIQVKMSRRRLDKRVEGRGLDWGCKCRTYQYTQPKTHHRLVDSDSLDNSTSHRVELLHNIFLALIFMEAYHQGFLSQCLWVGLNLQPFG